MTVPSPAPAPLSETDVLVIGTGPSGLMAGLVLARRGVRALVVDQKPGPTRESRAIVIQARSMEILDQLGLADAVLDSAQPALRVQIRGGAQPVRADFSRRQQDDTPFPGAQIFEQSRTETLLAETLAAEGSPVAYGHRLVSLTPEPAQEGAVPRADAAAGPGASPARAPEASTGAPFEDAAGVEALLEGPDGPLRVRARFVIGADGASSPVRHLLGLGFEGVTDDATFCVADLHGVEGAPENALSTAFGRERFALLFPLGPGGHARLIWLHGQTQPDQEEALAGARADLGIRYREVAWFSAYRVHHRVATHFRRGPVLLAGDAAHVHSPVGGQGMNTGLQDAHHLAHLLADIMQGRLAETALARYEAERRPVALTLIRVTDRAFGLISRPGRGTAFLRRQARDVLAVLAPRVLASRAGPYLAGLLGQYRIHYHPVPEGRPLPRWAQDGAVGRRLRPTPENRSALRAMRWQLHVYGADAARPAVPDEVEGPLAFPADPRGRMRRDRLYLIRPDGFVAAALPLHAGAATSADVTEALTACDIVR